MQFTKMHGLGNDYLYYYGELEDVENLSIKLSHRHFGIGSDGIITISHSDVADFKMRIFNADGSEAMMCGNGIRCVGKYVYDNGYTSKTVITVETKSGIKTLHLQLKNNKVDSVTVDMGNAVVGQPGTVSILGQEISYVPVSMGNPHAVVFVDAEGLNLVHTVGPVMEKHERFPGGVNAEFVEKTGENHLRMRVWERGSGITMACGTGACASTAAAIAKGYCEAGVPVQVDLDGGSLFITISADNRVEMVGPAETICECEVA